MFKIQESSTQTAFSPRQIDLKKKKKPLSTLCRLFQAKTYFVLKNSIIFFCISQYHIINFLRTRIFPNLIQFYLAHSRGENRDSYVSQGYLCVSKCNEPNYLHPKGCHFVQSDNMLHK